MRKIFALMLAIAMVLTMVACGKKADNKADSMVTPELYISTVDGKDTVVDKDGKAVTGYTLDKDGNVVDGSGKLVLAAQQLKALPSKAAESKPEADTKTDVKTDAKPAGGSSDSSSDSGNSGSSTPVAPDPTPVHQHSWEPVYKTVEDYEMREISYCVTCGQDMTGWSNAQLIEHSDYHLDRGESDQWRSEGRQVKVGEHQEIDYYICSCGATKAP